MRGTVEQPIDLRPRAGVVDPDLHADDAGGAGAGTSRAHRHQRAHRDIAEVLAELGRALVGLDKVPPGGMFVLR